MGNGGWGGGQREKKTDIDIPDNLRNCRNSKTFFFFFNLLNRLVYFKISDSFSIAETEVDMKTSHILDTPLSSQRRY